MSDTTMGGLLMAAIAFLALAVVTWLLHFFVALKSPPMRRAAWTAGVAYVIVAVAVPFSLPEESWWEVPLAAVPGALIAFWWWRSDFRRSWIDPSGDVPEGVELANDDWRIGLIIVGGVIVFLLFRLVIRLLVRGQL
jgi:hypothetical protein